MPACAAPETVLYLEAFKPRCLRPCKKEAPCPAGQACTGTAHKVAEGIGTARDVVDVCEPSSADLPTVAAGTKTLDTSDWKGASSGSSLALRWTVDQTKARPSVTSGSDLTRHKVPLELTMTVAGRPHTVSLVTDAAPAYSDACSRVSFFYAGLNIVFQVERAHGGRALLTRTETNESAPTKRAQLYTFELPPDLEITQEIVTIAPDGKRSAKTCTSTTLAPPIP